MNIYPVKQEIKLDSGWTAALPGDVFLAYENGALYLTGGETPVREVKITFNARIPEETLILGDAWERGYGELKWRKPTDTGVLPWYFLAKSNGKTLCFGVKPQPNAMCYR